MISLSLTIIVSGAAIGTALLIIIILLLIIVVLCVKRKKYRRAYHHKDIISVTNQVHDSIKDKHTKCNDFSYHNEVKLESANCLYEPIKIETTIEMADVSITPNTSYAVYLNSVQSRRETECQYDYVHSSFLKSFRSSITEERLNNASSDDNVRIEFNTSYSLSN